MGCSINDEDFDYPEDFDHRAEREEEFCSFCETRKKLKPFFMMEMHPDAFKRMMK
jgi:hypothetical protein